MTADDLNRRLGADEIVAVPAAEWAEIEAEFEEVERHDTLVAGDLLIVRGRAGLAAVEQPSLEQRVVRAMSDITEARGFVQGRLEQYERMWDGCGCKVDYYA